MAKVEWSLTASNELEEIEDFIARDSVLHAVTFIDKIVDSVEKLHENPRIGRIVPEFNRSNLRELLFRGYRIVYLVGDDSLVILRVVHGARDFTELVGKESWDIG